MTENSTMNETPDDARNVPQVNQDQDGRSSGGCSLDPDHDRPGRQPGAQSEDRAVEDDYGQDERPGHREARYRRERNEAAPWWPSWNSGSRA